GSCVTICCSSDQCAGLCFQSSVASSDSTNGPTFSSVGTSIIETARLKAYASCSLRFIKPSPGNSKENSCRITRMKEHFQLQEREGCDTVGVSSSHLYH